MLRCVLLFAVSSGSVVNSVTVKAGSNTPKPNDPVVVRGWRSDGFQKMDRTPKKAEKTLGKEVAPNDDLFNTNDYQKYYGRPFVLTSLESTDWFPTPFLLFMKTIVAFGKLRGKKTVFTFGKGNCLEENVLGPVEYALGGFLSKREVISFGKGNGFSGGYGTLKLVEPGCTKDHIVSTGYSKGPLGRGNYMFVLEAEQVP